MSYTTDDDDDIEKKKRNNGYCDIVRGDNPKMICHRFTLISHPIWLEA